MKPIEFTIYGEARPAGSKQSFPVLGVGGEPIRSDTGRIITRVKHDNPKTSDWMTHVANTAGNRMAGNPLLDGPLKLTLVFCRTRPKSHFGTGRNAGKLKESAPRLPVTRPDTVKLTRAVEDALTGVVWRDDSQVTTHVLLKRYRERYSVDVLIEADDPLNESEVSDVEI